MGRFEQDASIFASQKLADAAEAAQRVALRLLGGIDLSTALAAGPEEKAKLVERIERLITRERIKGLKRHWSYDLNRHIALKQALDKICEAPSCQTLTVTGASIAKPTRKKGKRRHRRRSNLQETEKPLGSTAAL